MKDFIVIDTEGKDELTEIAIVDSQGKVIYEAFVKDELNAEGPKINAKSLKDIIGDFLNQANSKLIICHYADHDIGVLKNSFKKVNIEWQNLEFGCTFELSKKHLKNVKSYSLEYLSQHLNLQVDDQYFNQNFAHSAKYDALFTYQLYLKLMPPQPTMLPKKHNPYGTSRVDTPFQQYHVDLKELFQEHFENLKSILTEIKHDPNHQSKGAVVIGEAGSGKTHLMMRLAKELLKSNRLLFIRQPNNPDAVLYHIYSRILESFVEMIPSSEYSQLEYLLAHSFSKITIDFLNKKEHLTKNQEKILDTLSQEPLNIYNLFSKNSDRKRKNWQWIEKSTLEWWNQIYGFGGHSPAIIKGLIKFCRYSDIHKRDLVRKWLAGNQLEASELEQVKLENWAEEISQEEFSLEAISVFSKLSIVDEPLMIIFDQLEGLKDHEQLLLNFGEAVKEIFTHAPNCLIIINLFPDRWQYFKSVFNDAVVDRISQHEIVLNKPTDAQLKLILALKAQENDLALKSLFTPEELKVILNQNSIRSVLNWASHYYKYKVEGIPLPKNLRSFEDEVRLELKKLTEEVAWLKQTLIGIEPKIAQTTSHYQTSKPENVASHQNLLERAPPSHQELNSDDNRLKVYLEEQKVLLENAYQKKVIISDSDDIGKVMAISNVFKTFKNLEMDKLRLGKRKIPEHLLIKTQKQAFVVGFLHQGGSTFTSRIKNFNELVINYKEIRFGLFRDVRESKVTGKVGLSEIEKLNNAQNGKFIEMDQENRLSFELIYQLIVDIQNRDFEIDLQKALTILESLMSDYWLIKIFRNS
jgi:DNA polymerase III epsilon subunit-like protein